MFQQRLIGAESLSRASKNDIKVKKKKESREKEIRTHRLHILTNLHFFDRHSIRASMHTVTMNS